MAVVDDMKRGGQALVNVLSGGHTLTLRQSQGTTFVGDPIPGIPYAVDTYSKDERNGIATGTQKLVIAALSLPEGVDLTAQRYRITDATGQAVKLVGVELAAFDVSMGGGEPALYTVPLTRGR